MSDEVVRDFPLFPLGIVALPHEIVPLHIFEERYRTMIGECLDRGSEFGIVWAADDGRRPIGCAVEIAEVLERMEDGRMNILTRGTRHFRIVDEQDDLPYPAGTVEFLLDKEETADSGTADSAHEAYGELVEQATDRTLEPSELVAMSAYEMAATVDFGREAKQGLLRPPLRERPPAARRTPAPRRDQAPGVHRARAGAGALEREGSLRLRKRGRRPCAPSHEPARISTSPPTAASVNDSPSSTTPYT